jgi:hypothetical protein
MSERDDVSRELRNAFVDNELGRADWDRIAERLRGDESLRAEICALRQTKDLVRRAYAPVTPPRRDAAPRTRWAAVAALCLFSAAAGWLAHDRFPGSSADGELALGAARAIRHVSGERIVVHVSSAQPELLATALEEVEDVLRAARERGRGIEVEIVANSSGLVLLRADASPFAERIAELRARYPNLTLVACNQTIDRLREKGVAVRLLPGVEVAPSALDQVVKRLQGGWVYVRA